MASVGLEEHLEKIRTYKGIAGLKTNVTKRNEVSPQRQRPWIGRSIRYRPVQGKMRKAVWFPASGLESSTSICHFSRRAALVWERT